MSAQFLIVTLVVVSCISFSSSSPLIKCNGGTNCIVLSAISNNEQDGSAKISQFNQKYPPPCPSEVYCHGHLLHTVQMAGIYNDSKTFVDMKMHASPEETLAKFETFMASHNDKPTNAELKEWVETNFAKPGSEFESWTPDDWHDNPKFLDKVKNDDMKDFAHQLHNLWLQLGRKMTNDVKVNNNLYSIIHVDHPVIVPGGRFREFYYWDSYWIVRGLLLSEMQHTVKGMLQNFRSIIQQFGFIPNGGRIYYSARSQPPLLAGMIKSYVDATGDEEFAIDSAEDLAHEFQFFMNNHTIHVKGHNVAIYGDKSSGPRPESYREDVETGGVLATDEEKEEYYAELKAGAESGMDFSSRFFIKNGTNEGGLIDLKTRSIVPVDLNAILYWNAKIIAEFYRMGNNLERAEYFESEADRILKAINAILWNEEVGSWLDYDMINNKPRDYFVPSNLFPLWCKAFNHEDENKIAEKVLKYIENLKLDDYPGGVPNTFADTGEQWDFPNVWPPMQYALIMGLDTLNNEKTKELAYKWAEKWVQSNYVAFTEARAMFEKYSALEVGGHGGGGEYEVQLGFGWSNGVVMDLLDKYGDKIAPPGHTTGAASLPTPATTGILAAVLALLSTTLRKFVE